MKNLCILSVLFFSVIFLNLVQSATVSEQANEKEEPQQQLKDYISDCFALINSYRAKHGSPPLAFDGGLTGAAASCARRYAGGAAVHSCPEARGLAENVATSSGGGTPQSLCNVGVHMWYAENRQYNYNNPNINNWQNTGHFTYMIWRSSTAGGLACAPGGTVRCVALFRPKGNTPSAAAYKANIGPPRKEEEEEKEENQSQLIFSQNVTIS